MVVSRFEFLSSLKNKEKNQYPPFMKKTTTVSLAKPILKQAAKGPRHGRGRRAFCARRLNTV